METIYNHHNMKPLPRIVPQKDYIKQIPQKILDSYNIIQNALPIQKCLLLPLHYPKPYIFQLQ